MEIDFMGLRSLSVVKEELNDEDRCRDSGFTKGSAPQWPFSNNLMSFKASHDDKNKILSDPLTSAGFSSKIRPLVESQKSFNHDGQGGFHFSLTPYPVQHDVKMFSVSNQAMPFSLGNPFLKNHFVTSGHNMNGDNVKLPLHAGIPVTTPPTIGDFAGMTESCNIKPSAPSAQLTIFYGGTVNVFDDISAEKAQAIMLLAGNGLSVASNTAQTKIQASGSKLAAGEGVLMSQPANTPPCPGHSSPLSVSSNTGAQSGSGSTSTDEFLANKTTGVPTNLVSNVEPTKVVSAATMLTSAVPQFRKASLARFLEKRKESFRQTHHRQPPSAATGTTVCHRLPPPEKFSDDQKPCSSPVSASAAMFPFPVNKFTLRKPCSSPVSAPAAVFPFPAGSVTVAAVFSVKTAFVPFSGEQIHSTEAVFISGFCSCRRVPFSGW